MLPSRVPDPLPPLGQTLYLPSEAHQRDFGAGLSALSRGSVLFLEGELGTGKTTLTQGLLAALGFEGLVSSPTYALMQLYPTPQGQVLHVDAYRVRHPQELWEMDLEMLSAEARLSILEWGEHFYADFPEAPILRLEHVRQGQTGRILTRLR